MYPVSPGWRWRPISRTRRGVAHLCTFPPSGEVLLPNCPPPGGGLDIRWWKSCLFECALPGGTVRRPFHRGGGCPCAGHLPEADPRLALAIYRKPTPGWGWPFTGSRYPAGAGHLPEAGTPRGGVHASATFTGPEGIPDRRVHTSAIYRKVYPCRRVPGTAIYRKVDPDRRVHALAIYRKPVPGAVGTRRGRFPAKAMVIRAPARPHGRHHGKHGNEARVVVPWRSDLRGKHPIFKR